MKNHIIGKTILVALGLAILTAIFEKELSYVTSENLFILSGLLLFIFGTWGSVRLINSDKIER